MRGKAIGSPLDAGTCKASHMQKSCTQDQRSKRTAVKARPMTLVSGYRVMALRYLSPMSRCVSRSIFEIQATTQLGHVLALAETMYAVTILDYRRIRVGQGGHVAVQIAWARDRRGETSEEVTLSINFLIFKTAHASVDKVIPNGSVNIYSTTITPLRVLYDAAQSQTAHSHTIIKIRLYSPTFLRCAVRTLHPPLHL